MREVIIHDYRFGIDTSDWLHSNDAEMCEAAIEAWLSGHSAEQASALHTALARWARDEDCDETLVHECYDFCEQMATKVMREQGYMRLPDTGHNATVVAIEEAGT